MAPPSPHRAWAAGLTLTVRDGALVARPKAGITPALRAGLGADKATLLAILSTPTLYLNAALPYAVADLPATAADVRDWLAPEDVDDLHTGRIEPSHFRALVQPRLRLCDEHEPRTNPPPAAANSFCRSSPNRG